MPCEIPSYVQSWTYFFGHRKLKKKKKNGRYPAVLLLVSFGFSERLDSTITRCMPIFLIQCHLDHVPFFGLPYSFPLFPSRHIFSPVSFPKVDVHESLFFFFFSFNFKFCTAQIPLPLIMSLNVSVMMLCHVMISKLNLRFIKLRPSY